MPSKVNDPATLQQLNTYASGGNQDRQIAMRELTTDQPSPRRQAAQTQPAQQQSVNPYAETERQAAMQRIEEQKRQNLAAQQSAASRPKMNIEEVLIRTPDGDEIGYRDRTTGRTYKFNPNEAQALPDDAMRIVASKYGSRYSGVITFDNGQAWQFKNGEVVQRVK